MPFTSWCLAKCLRLKKKALTTFGPVLILEDFCFQNWNWNETKSKASRKIWKLSRTGQVETFFEKLQNFSNICVWVYKNLKLFGHFWIFKNYLDFFNFYTFVKYCIFSSFAKFFLCRRLNLEKTLKKKPKNRSPRNMLKLQ